MAESSSSPNLRTVSVPQETKHIVRVVAVMVVMMMTALHTPFSS